MGFATPNLLPLVSLAALPVLIHLISRLRLRRADFPSLFLLQSVRRERFSWLRLKELLLLILRTLALAALLLSLTRPYLRRALAGLGSGQDLIVVIDDSYSMAYGSRWARAKEVLGAIFNHLGRGQRVWLLTGSQPDTAHVLRRAQWSTVDSIKPSYTGATLERTVAKAVQLAKAERAAVVVITDLQERALPSTVKVPQDIVVTLIDVGESDFNNVGVVEVRPDNRLNARKLEVTIANYSSNPVTRVVSWEWQAASDGGKQRTGEEKAILLKPQGRNLVNFDAPAEPSTIKFQLEQDSLEADNCRYCVLQQLKEIPVLVVQSSEEATGFLGDALGPDSVSGFRLTVIDSRQLSRTELRQFPVVVVTDAGTLSARDWDRLHFHLQTGGAVLVMAGPGLAPETGLERFIRVIGTSRKTGFVSLTEMDTTHPALDILRLNDLATARFFSHLKLDPAGARVLARLSDSDPLIIETAEGRLHIWSFTLTPECTDLMFKAAFVPLLHRTLCYLGSVNRRTEFLVGDTIRVILDRAQPFTLMTPHGNFALTPDVALGRPRAIWTDTRTPGFYRFGDRGPTVAVNVVSEEGDLTRADADRLRSQGFRIQGFDYRAESAGLAPLLLYLAAAAFGVEMILLAL